MGLTLRKGNREYFYSQLDRHFPGMKEKYIQTYGLQYQCGKLDTENSAVSAAFGRKESKQA